MPQIFIVAVATETDVHSEEFFNEAEARERFDSLKESRFMLSFSAVTLPPAADWAGCCRASQRIWQLFNAMQKGTPADLKFAPTATTAEMIASELGIETPSDDEAATCDCTDCPVCEGHTVCGRCKQCARCHDHAPGCEGCPA
jgi:hypothetical protein